MFIRLFSFVMNICDVFEDYGLNTTKYMNLDTSFLDNFSLVEAGPQVSKNIHLIPPHSFFWKNVSSPWSNFLLLIFILKSKQAKIHSLFFRSICSAWVWLLMCKRQNPSQAFRGYTKHAKI